MKLNSFNYLVRQGMSSIWKNRLMSFASFCIMTVSMLMVGLSILITININLIIGGIEDKNQIIVQVKDDTSEGDIQLLEAQLKKIPNLFEVVFFSRDQAWESMKESMSDEQQDLFQYADSNPLPDTFKIRVSELEKIDETALSISALANVESVNTPKEFTDILLAVKTVVAVVSTAIVSALVIVCMVIISNTTRTSVFARRKEINIMKYVGASNAFIKIPFFVEGMVLGLVSAATALVATRFAYNSLFEVLTSKASLINAFSFSSMISIDDVLIMAAVSYGAAGILLGAFGTVLSTGKHLKV
ncbi:MAG: permease-like cell division protein FtsX [Oscillospiraceae bacterium]|jgi:cell division transport system permease protein